MSPKLLKVIIPGALAILLIACAGQPVHNVDNAPINVASPNYDLSDVTKAIHRAGAGLGWQMKEETPGHIVGKLYVRSHVAIIDVTYTLDEYSVNYKDSTNLKYNASSNTIHKNYNGWIQNLTRAIDSQIASL